MSFDEEDPNPFMYTVPSKFKMEDCDLEDDSDFYASDDTVVSFPSCPDDCPPCEDPDSLSSGSTAFSLGACSEDDQDTGVLAVPLLVLT